MRILPTKDHLRKILSYEYETGLLRWRDVRPCGRRQPGRIAGCKKDNGRIQIYIDNKPYYAHRIIWKYIYGDFDESLMIDHIDGSPTNNSFLNLRLVNRQENSKNCKLTKGNVVGVMGVYYFKPTKKWHASITINRIKNHLGCFNSKEEAILARKDAEKQHNFHYNHGRV